MFSRAAIRNDPSDGAYHPTPLTRMFDLAGRPSAEAIDEAWLRRRELRSLKDATRHLSETGFGNQPPGRVTVLFVDDRCGLIRSDTIGAIDATGPDEIVRRILRTATQCDASAFIVATRDPQGKITRSVECGDLTAKLYRKGEAIGVYLLNHVVLTVDGWKQLFSAKDERRVQHVPQ